MSEPTKGYHTDDNEKTTAAKSTEPKKVSAYNKTIISLSYYSVLCKNLIILSCITAVSAVALMLWNVCA